MGPDREYPASEQSIASTQGGGQRIGILSRILPEFDVIVRQHPIQPPRASLAEAAAAVGEFCPVRSKDPQER